MAGEALCPRKSRCRKIETRMKDSNLHWGPVQQKIDAEIGIKSVSRDCLPQAVIACAMILSFVPNKDVELLRSVWC